MTTLTQHKNADIRSQVYIQLVSLGFIQDGEFINDCVLKSKGCPDLEIHNYDDGDCSDRPYSACFYLGMTVDVCGELRGSPQVVIGVDFDNELVYPIRVQRFMGGWRRFRINDTCAVSISLESNELGFINDWLGSIITFGQNSILERAA